MPKKKNQKPARDLGLTDAEPDTGEQYGEPIQKSGRVIGTDPEASGVTRVPVVYERGGGIYLPHTVVAVGLVTGLAFVLYKYMAMSGPQALSWALGVVIGIILASDSPKHLKNAMQFVRRLRDWGK